MTIPARFNFGSGSSGGTGTFPNFDGGFSSGSVTFTDVQPGPGFASAFVDTSSLGTFWDANTFTLRSVGGTARINIDLANNKIGFFGAAAVAKPTGVAVSAAGVHAALVTLGLIAP